MRSAPAPPMRGRRFRSIRKTISCSCRPAARALTTTAARASARPVRELGGRAACEDRRPRLGLPDSSITTSGTTTIRLSRCSATIRRNGVDVPRRARHQDRRPVRAQPRDGRAIVPGRGAARAATDVPGEQTSPTQPFPAAPPPLVPQSFSADDAWGSTPAIGEVPHRIGACATTGCSRRRGLRDR